MDKIELCELKHKSICNENEDDMLQHAIVPK